MGITGRKRATKTDLMARGERRPSRLNYEEPAAQAADPAMAPPDDLDGRGRDEWVRIFPELCTTGHLGRRDVLAFEDYCRKYSQWWALQLERARLPLLAAKKAGILDEEHKLFAEIYRMRVALGLTPANRTSVRAIKAAVEKSDPKSKYLKMLQAS